MPIFNNILAGSSGQGDTGYDIDQSLRFEDGDGYLTRTFGSAGNRKTWTYSVWCKKAQLDNDLYLFSSDYSDSSNFLLTKLSSSSKGYGLEFQWRIAEATTRTLLTSQAFRDVGSWYHIVLVCDTTEASASDRLKVYVNGAQVTDFSTDNRSNISQNADTAINRAAGHGIAEWAGTAQGGGYFAEVNFIDGTALDASSFGETDSATNQWVPIKYAGSYGTNGFYLPFSNTELNNFVDSASRTVTANGNVHTDTSVKKIGTASAQFDGTGDYLSMLGNPDFDFDTSAFTIEAWVYPTNVTDWMAIFSSPNYYTSGYNGNWVIDMYNGNVRMNVYNGTGAVGNVDGTTSLTASTWQHLAVCRDDSGTTRIFKDGTLISSASTNLNGDDIEDGKNGFWIGETTASGGPGDFNGYMDEIRVSKSARYTSNFTPSTTAFTTDSDTMLLLHCDGSDSGTTFTDSSGRPRHAITANGDVTNSRAEKKIGSSSIKFDGNGDYLTVPDSDDWDFGTGDFTVEHWFRPRSIPSSDTHTTIFSGTSWPPGFRFYYGSSAVPYFRVEGSAYEFTGVTLSADTWYHMAASREGTNLRLFIDGDLKATHTDSTNINSSGVLYIGRRGDTTSDDANVYLDEIRISDTARYTSSFTPSTTAFTDDSNTKLLIHSNFDGGLGADSSGNTNDFSATNIVATDVVGDSPTNNFATLNPLVPTIPTLSEGNLKGASTSTSTVSDTAATFSPTSGKWYWEICLNQLNLDNSTGYVQFNIGGGAYIWSYYNTPTTQIVANTTTAISNFSAGDILQFAVDIDNGKAWFGNNGTWYTTSGTPNPSAGTGQAYTFTYSGDFWSVGMARFQMRSGSGTQIAICNFGQDSSFAGTKTAQNNTDGNGIGDFYYTPPSGYLALCTDNLSDPSIADPTKYFNTVLYTGNGSNPRSITGVGFQPDFHWRKKRNASRSHNLHDVVRGAANFLYSDATAAEVSTDGNGTLSSFDSDGFTFNSEAGDENTNNSGDTYVTWNWKAGGTASSNTDGTITSSVSANTTAGFSIVAWTGTGSNATVGHGLSQAPDLIINKSRDDAYNWAVQSILFNSASDTNLLYLNTTAAAADDTNVFQAAPTATVFSPQGGSWSGIGASGVDYIAYCFHSVDGFSKIGSYQGNGNNDGPFIYTGFQPAFFLVKKYATVGGDNWAIYDNKRNETNVMNTQIYPDSNSTEESSSARNIDFLSNGVKIRGTNSRTNDSSSHSFLYMAFAEFPFKTSNAR